MLAALGGAAVGNALDLVDPAADQAKPAAGAAVQAKPGPGAAGQAKPAPAATATPAAAAAPAAAAEKEKPATNPQGSRDAKQSDDVSTDTAKIEKGIDKKAESGQTVGAKR
jgi:hypothetical protein